MPTQELGESRWHRNVTIGLSAIALVAGGIWAVYVNQQNAQRERVAAIEKRIEQVEAQREKLAALPKFEIVVTTLADARFPEALFRQLKEIPSVVRVSHKSGLSAKGITVSIAASSSVIRFIKSPSLDDYTVTQGSSNAELVLNIPRLRPASVVEIVVITNQISRIETSHRAEDGSLVSDDKDEKSARGSTREELFTRLVLRARGGEINTSQIRTVEDADNVLENLREAARLGKRHIPLLDDIPWSSFWAVIFAGVFFGWLILSSAKEYYSDRKVVKDARDRARRVGEVKGRNAIQIGMDKAEVEAALGKPTSINIKTIDGGPLLIWNYQIQSSKSHPFQSVAVFEFEGDKVRSMEYQDSLL